MAVCKRPDDWRFADPLITSIVAWIRTGLVGAFCKRPDDWRFADPLITSIVAWIRAGLEVGAPWAKSTESRLEEDFRVFQSVFNGLRPQARRLSVRRKLITKRKGWQLLCQQYFRHFYRRLPSSPFLDVRTIGQLISLLTPDSFQARRVRTLADRFVCDEWRSWGVKLGRLGN